MACDSRAVVGLVPWVVVSDVDLLRRRVLNVVGHELRTPVSTLTGLAAELESCTDDGRRSEITTAVVRNARRLDRLVDDLLLAAGITTVVPVDDREPVRLLEAARAMWAGPEATFAGQATAFARPASVRRALAEIVGNAIVYGTAPYAVAAWEEDGRAIVEVANAGPDVAATDLDLATELFFRGERAVTTRAGLGVGLALARTLLRADGGDVTLRPRDGGGVVARVELPVRGTGPG